MSKDKNNTLQNIDAVSDMYQNWFLEYASYVILDRAVPALEDGLKPVQRRILHALKEMDDGRFNKVANVIGQTMQYHPHGDASIYEAMIGLGQKDLMIDMQGNWGDVRTGDDAAAARYIEARLSKFALEVAFNPNITDWQLSYDGRKREPLFLPIKFPLLLAQGVEGIAVGLQTKILPHNFIEIIKASIQVLNGQKPNLLPDFITGGYIDVANYNEGKRGGKIRVRAKMEVVDKKFIVIKEIPFGTTTANLIDSIVKANEKGKIKIKKVIDNTAKNVEIVIELIPGTDPHLTLDALYAFTDCENSISPNCCLIIADKPNFIGVNELLELSTKNTLTLLNKELKFNLNELEEKLHYASLEKIFIEKRIYRKIEECETFEAVTQTVQNALIPYTKQFIRPITPEDILKLLEIKIKRISKYDSFKADEAITKLNNDIANIKHHLQHLTQYAISYFDNLLQKYAKGKERKTEIKNFDTIEIVSVAATNTKLFVNKKEGFIGSGLKKDEFVCECSDLDDVIVFCANGKYKVVKIADKTFVGKDIIHLEIWKKNNDRKVYHAVYFDGKNMSFVKRFNVTAVTRDKEYDLTQGDKNSIVQYFSVHNDGESEVIGITLSDDCRAKNKYIEYNFAELAVKGRDTKGNVLTVYPVKTITHLEKGSSTLAARKIFFDPLTGRLNTEEKGQFLGEFSNGNKIFVIYKNGCYELTNYELSNRYDVDNIEIIEKYIPDSVVSTVYYHGGRDAYYVKRFKLKENSELNHRYTFISIDKGSEMLMASLATKPVASIYYTNKKGGDKLKKEIILNEIIEVKGWDILGNKLNFVGNKITQLKELKPKPKPETPTALPVKTNESNNKPIKSELF